LKNPLINRAFGDPWKTVSVSAGCGEKKIRCGMLNVTMGRKIRAKYGMIWRGSAGNKLNRTGSKAMMSRV
jgi:hypothetical protein